MLEYELKEPINYHSEGRSFDLRKRIEQEQEQEQEHTERCHKVLEKYIEENVIPQVCKGHTYTYRVDSFFETDWKRWHTFYCSCGKALGRLELDFKVKVA